MVSKETVKNLLENPIEGKGKEIIADCPFCFKKEHFFINKNSFLFSCKKCGEDGNLKKLLGHLNKLYLLEGDSIGTTIIPLELAEEESHLDLELPTQKLPIGFTTLNYNDDNRFANYLRERKFTELDFELYQPGYTELVGRYENYVLLPIQRDLQVKGLVGRYILNKSDKGYNPDKKRYENSKGTNFAKLLLGIDEITRYTNTIVVVEGPFDKVSVTTELDLNNQQEVKCVSTFGKKVSEYQLALLSKYSNITSIIFMYDIYDAINDMKRGGISALTHFKNVYACRHITQNDPGDMKADEILTALDSVEKIQNFVYNRVKINPIS